MFANQGISFGCETGMFTDCSGTEEHYEEYKNFIIEMYNHFSGISAEAAIFNAKNKLLKLQGAKGVVEGWYEHSDLIDNYLGDMKNDIEDKIASITAIMNANSSGTLTEEQE